MRVPKYRCQTKALPDGSKRKKGFVEYQGKRHYFKGAFNSKESVSGYKLFIRTIAADDPVEDNAPSKLRIRGRVSVGEAIELYLLHIHAQSGDDGGRTPESYHVDRMAAFLLESFPATPLTEFGPLCLREIQSRLKSARRLSRCKIKNADGSSEWGVIETKQPLSIRYVNDQIARVRRFFRWCVAEELVPSAVADALGKIEPLRPSRTERTEARRQRKKVRAIDKSVIDAVLPFLSPTLAAMAQLHELTGMRPTELCTMRSMNIETGAADGIWEYRPECFKGDTNEETEAIVPLGPKAQKILKPFIASRGASDYLFSPRESLSWHHEQRWSGKGTSKRREPKTYRTIGEVFTAASYRKAIARAAEKAGVPHWFPYQLRHSFGTVVRKKHGLEGAQVALRHKHADVTQVYAERNLDLARTIAREMG